MMQLITLLGKAGRGLNPSARGAEATIAEKGCVCNRRLADGRQARRAVRQDAGHECNLCI